MKNKTSFGKFAKSWDEKTEKGIRSSHNTIKGVFELLGTVKGKNVYEIACGNGFLARQLVEQGAKEVWASDISSELIAIAKSKYDEGGINYLVRDGIDIKGFPKDYFDAVVLHQGVYYIENIDALCKAVYKILKPGGSFIFTATHPLIHDARLEMGDETDARKENLRYLKIFTRHAKKEWSIGGKKIIAKYDFYRRPMSFYINACGRNKLYISNLLEPATLNKVKNKPTKTTIPSSLIIKAAKCG